MPHLGGSTSRAERSARGSVCCAQRNSTKLGLVIVLVVIPFTPSTSPAQFQLWAEFPVENPFSVTTAVRGLQPPPGPGQGPPPVPQIRLEAIAGYFSTVTFQNQFDYHGSIAVGALELGAGSRRLVDTKQPIMFTDSGRQTAFDGLCCSNNGLGFDHDRSVYLMTDFSVAPAHAFEVSIGLPERDVPRGQRASDPLMSRAEPGGDPCEDLDISDLECAFSAFEEWIDGGDPFDRPSDTPGPQGGIPPESVLRECYAVVADELGTAGLTYHEFVSEFFDRPAVSGQPEQGPPTGSTFIERAVLPDCVNPFTSWHFTSTHSGELGEVYVGCASVSSFSFVIKRIDLSDYSVTEIPLQSNIPIPTNIFAYLHTAACRVNDGVVLGAILPRADLGTTSFFAVKLDPAGAVQATASIDLPGARANKQAFFCRPHENFASFVYHGSGANPAQTDTFVIQADGSGALRIDGGLGQSMSVWTMSEDRETLWADAFPTRIGATNGVDQYSIKLTYAGLEPIAEADGDMAGGGTNSKVRYGGIEVPIMFSDFETADFRYWSSVQGGS